MKNDVDDSIKLKIFKKWFIRILIAKIFNKKIVFWGASLFLEEFLERFHIKTSAIIGIVDKNSDRQGQDFCGYKILNPEEIKSLKPDYVIFAIKNNNKRIYQEIYSFVKYNVPKSKIRKNDFLIYEDTYAKHNNDVVEQLNEIITEIAPQKAVYIFQFSFFSKNGDEFFSGGAERYMRDLASLIRKLGYVPILIQSGRKIFEKPWVRKMKDLTVIGVNTMGENYYKVINQLKSPELAIYSGIIGWHSNIKYKNNILISHGITWDIPRIDVDITKLKTVLQTFNHIVSVDTSTICWFRSTFSYFLSKKKLDMEYIPNYVDTNKFLPLNNKRDKIKITFPRRCSDERGIWLFANIVPKIIENHKDVSVEFVGFIHTNDIRDKINELISKYPENVTHKVCEQDKMYEIYQNTDISVIPTLYSEGTSLSCLEAMACGNAVVATNVGGLPNLIINNYNGKLVNPDEVSVYNAIDELLINEDLRKNLSQKAIEISKVFSKENWYNNWTNVLKKYLK